MTDDSCQDSRDIASAIAQARSAGQSLYIRGGDSKRNLAGRQCDAEPLDVSGLRGIIDYQPGELVITAKAATPVADVVAALAQEGQMLACEPPLFDGRGTLGGTLACNLSGPARPWWGALRDQVLGVQLINGKSELLNFGGRVIKNVAGYDVSRLQAGALGTLGVLTRITLKTQPLPEHSADLVYEMGAQAAVEAMTARAREPKPLSAACWVDGRLYLRLSGAASAVTQTARIWGGDQLPANESPWEDLRELSLPCFRGDEPLWRLSVKPTTAVDPGLENTIIDWGGAQRWVSGERDAASLYRIAANAGGHACLFRGGDRRGDVRQPATSVEQRIQKRLKRAFDPDGVLNPGRLYSWL